MNFANHFTVDLFTCRYQHIAIVVHNIELGSFATQTIHDQIGLNTVFTQIIGLAIVKHIQHFAIAITQCTQQNRYRHFAATVNAEIQQVFGIEFKIQPRTTVWNNPCRKQQLAGRMRFAAVMLEKHAWRTVQLRHDDTLRTVNHKRTAWCHQRNFAHIYCILANFFNFAIFHFGRALFIENNQLDFGAQWCRIGNTTQLTLRNIKLRLTQNILFKLQLCITVIAYDWENRTKSSLQPFIDTFIGGTVLLQKFIIGFQLRCQQIWNFQNGLTLRKTFTNTFFLSKRIIHYKTPRLKYKFP